MVGLSIPLRKEKLNSRIDVLFLVTSNELRLLLLPLARIPELFQDTGEVVFEHQELIDQLLVLGISLRLQQVLEENLALLAAVAVVVSEILVMGL